MPSGYWCPTGSTKPKQNACGHVDNFCPRRFETSANCRSGKYDWRTVNTRHGVACAAWARAGRIKTECGENTYEICTCSHRANHARTRGIVERTTTALRVAVLMPASALCAITAASNCTGYTACDGSSLEDTSHCNECDCPGPEEDCFGKSLKRGQCVLIARSAHTQRQIAMTGSSF